METSETKHRSDVNHVQRKVVNLEKFVVEKFGVDILSNITFIKIDAEGFDYHIFESISPMLGMQPNKPCIQVEYLAGFRRGNRGSTLSDDSRKFFEAIKALPVAYSLHCMNTNVFHARGSAPLSTYSKATLISEGNAVTSATLADGTDIGACEDILLVPPSHPMLNKA